ncbi:class I SAM-dependent methyltransferase [Sorangium sp. So ce1153]|uniref:class I SAM-dependent methyltransferase n=1 Tax=Sorangium sp. So ce1153 TaxID=3133333 RepID=UPI003F60E0E4
MSRAVVLPYFDLLLEALGRGNPVLAAAFGRHVHWGYWPDPGVADGSVADFVAAAERLCVRVCDAGGARDGQRILDVGCGFGGTLMSLNERFSSVELVGLNIDPRQLERARRDVQVRPGNRVDFQEGDACRMPFPDAWFDVVLAIECAFHFESRARFLAEARRVLRPGGRLALCDFVPAPVMAPFVAPSKRMLRAYFERFSGQSDFSTTLDRYRALGREAGLSPVHEEDITRGTLPTYPVVRRVLRELDREVGVAVAGAAAMELASRLGLLRYVILAFDRR